MTRETMKAPEKFLPVKQPLGKGFKIGAVQSRGSLFGNMSNRRVIEALRFLAPGVGRVGHTNLFAGTSIRAAIDPQNSRNRWNRSIWADT
jgi:hypothetical protein